MNIRKVIGKAEKARKTDKHPSCRAQPLLPPLDPIAQHLEDTQEHWQATRYHERGRVAFTVITRRPPLLVVLDTDTGKEVARVPVGGSCDDLYFDAERKRIYSLGGEGSISVIQQNDPNHYTLSANIPTTVGVRTVRTGVFFGTSLYVGVPAAGLEPAQIWNYAVPE